MAQTNRRQTQGVRRQARSQENTRRVRKAKSQGRSFFGYVLGLLPFTDAQLRRAFTFLILAGATGVLLFIASISGATTFVSQKFTQITSNAGYIVQQVEVQGVSRIDPNAIKARALNKPDLAMANYDVDAMRTELLTLPWVKDARVARQLPNVLVINIIEREQHAVLRRADRLMAIDSTGVELEPVSARDSEGMLLIEGSGAQAQVEALSTLLDAAPALRSQVDAAEWVGNRRWNLTFGSGQTLALPEGEDRAASALIAFAQADGVHRLIGGEVASFDMRNPPRMFMRVPGRAEAQELAAKEKS